MSTKNERTKVSTGKTAANGKPPKAAQEIMPTNIREIMVEPGLLYSQDAEKQRVDFRPTKYNDLLDAINGYKLFMALTGNKDALRQYVVVFAHGNLYQDAPRHAMLIQKPWDSSLHPGMLNLPGGRVELTEHPRDAAMREFYEETGWQIQQPQLMGLLLPSMYDFNRESPYIVYCYRGIIRTAEKQTALNEAHQLNIEKHCPQWYLIQDLGLKSSEQIVPNCIAVLPHMASESRCWLIQDCWRCDSEQNDFQPTKDMNFNAQVPPRLKCRTQEIVTYYTPDRTLDARMALKPKIRRHET